MPQLGPAEVLVILVVALLVFGPKRLPDVGRQVGRGLRELRKVQDTVRDEINSVIHHDDDQPTYAAAPPPPPTPIAGTGRPAPSRFRPAATPGVTADASSAPALSAAPPPPQWPAPPRRSVPAPARGAHAPSRFRAPGN